MVTGGREGPMTMVASAPAQVMARLSAQAAVLLSGVRGVWDRRGGSAA
jgi:hypothetical protein